MTQRIAVLAYNADDFITVMTLRDARINKTRLVATYDNIEAVYIRDEYTAIGQEFYSIIETTRFPYRADAEGLRRLILPRVRVPKAESLARRLEYIGRHVTAMTSEVKDVCDEAAKFIRAQQ
jgi:hypothetical protein